MTADWAGVFWVAPEDLEAGTFSVTLPHQCDRWAVAGDEYRGVPHDQAVNELESFLADGQRALSALRAGQGYGSE